MQTGPGREDTAAAWKVEAPWGREPARERDRSPECSPPRVVTVCLGAPAEQTLSVPMSIPATWRLTTARCGGRVGVDRERFCVRRAMAVSTMSRGE